MAQKPNTKSKAKVEAEEGVKPEAVEKPLDDFQKAIQGLRNRVLDMQLRPAEREKFDEDLDRLEKLR
jgi:hypothetical protein